MRLSPVLVALFVTGAIASVVACSSTSVPATENKEGAFGCCPDVKPSCTLSKNGPKASANDNCIEGYDGVVIDPNQDGWTLTTDKYGCGIWVAPPNGRKLACGVAPVPEPEDAGEDAGDSGRQDGSSEAGDASSDAGDASTD